MRTQFRLLGHVFDAFPVNLWFKCSCCLREVTAEELINRTVPPCPRLARAGRFKAGGR